MKVCKGILTSCRRWLSTNRTPGESLNSASLSAEDREAAKSYMLSTKKPLPTYWTKERPSKKHNQLVATEAHETPEPTFEELLKLAKDRARQLTRDEKMSREDELMDSMEQAYFSGLRKKIRELPYGARRNELVERYERAEEVARIARSALTLESLRELRQMDGRNIAHKHRGRVHSLRNHLAYKALRRSNRLHQK